MGSISFRRITPQESRILDSNGAHVGDVYGHDDILTGSRVFYLHLGEDPRGPRRVHERHRIRQVAQRLVDTHPLRS